MNKNFNENIDQKIKECLIDKADNASIPENMFFKIRNEILKEKDNKGVFIMKHKLLKAKTFIIAGMLIVATTVTCVAATNKSAIFGSSSHLTEVKTFPSEDKVKESVGFTPKYVGSFNNGFKFDTFNYRNNEVRDDKGAAVEKYKSADFDYKKEGSKKNQSLGMSAAKVDQKHFDENISNNAVSVEYKGIKIEYTSNQYKSVPEGYEPTDEEKELENKGLLEIGYGSDKDEIEVSQNQTVMWYEDGISYSILNMDYTELSQDDMINMAKEVIG
ncbi:hypothetical protein [Clostridium saccharobutylicum]|uniref:DUF4367 domain-containing protein n=1 Tax=Clostridium saccharobutylicum DSM 13864 TaxID=1345695 RepID=U5MTU7_CLOSA|nr:hypothetical protein [Clostridium saccharobutylicum]AGX44005.1 hypothetical protein CLSA_c30390 [Clostridium saccharobutylicum DSM 13864]AQR91298.1 hypothetical protein CLOSC_30230 [Clostridium saccharobutylicum]AQS01202.1 hypothetical protein CSACC_30300 [Clostridium saccharobutylicum]AQS10811.1 hypothetical protein CLOBY_29600 [Clostridium saccharobutylicum]AQS15185.1 hypothetical protein CLOSACC_30300 [Clostridium saccharobutylicum]